LSLLLSVALLLLLLLLQLSLMRRRPCLTALESGVMIAVSIMAGNSRKAGVTSTKVLLSGVELCGMPRTASKAGHLQPNFAKLL
jgi:hypothetical protein